jgi:hypothetical protein
VRPAREISPNGSPSIPVRRHVPRRRKEGVVSAIPRTARQI